MLFVDNKIKNGIICVKNTVKRETGIPVFAHFKCFEPIHASYTFFELEGERFHANCAERGTPNQRRGRSEVLRMHWVHRRKPL